MCDNVTHTIKYLPISIITYVRQRFFKVYRTRLLFIKISKHTKMLNFLIKSYF